MIFCSRVEVENRGQFIAQGKGPGDEQLQFRGVSRTCTLGENGQTAFCGDGGCKLCESITQGFVPYLLYKRHEQG